MKTFRESRFGRRGLAWGLAILSCGASVFAQTTDSNLVPVVTVLATQPFATTNHPGVFTVFRHGNTNATLNVWYDLGGTASNGVDYAMIPPHEVEIAAGATSNTVVIVPLTNPPSLSAFPTVVLTLTNSPLMTPVNYEIGSPSRATVYLEPVRPPLVKITVPASGTVFFAPTNILMAAGTFDLFPVTNVAFFAGTNFLGFGKPLPIVVEPANDPIEREQGWTLVWSNPPPGGYALTAVATDAGGLTATSAAVTITVQESLPPTNLPPIVRLVSPPNGKVFFAPVNIPLYAFARDPDGSIASVEFFADTNRLGLGRPVPVPVAPADGFHWPIIYPNFYLIWSNAPVGTWTLTAQATDNGGAVGVSVPVNITVLPSPPPPTNHPPLVSIVASDPVAVEGTNGWIRPGETNPVPTWSAWPPRPICFFTNYGPNTATFTVRRYGDLSNDLTVPYGIGGTASNGVDYVALPGAVTIPAGERRAFITIVPIDDGPPDVNKTVVLTLEPSTNTPPDYRLGFPRRAAAVILDPGAPWPETEVLPGGYFHLAQAGPDAAWFCIETSTNLTDWTPVCTNQVVHGSIDFVDPDAAAHAARFYRVVPLAHPPAE